MIPDKGPAWPALGPLPIEPVVFRCQRAIRGKVHRAATDYRWIASSRELPIASLGWENSLSLGIEDDPKILYLWSPVAGGFLGGRCYPSRARDAAGRTGGLEKHVLFWQLDNNVRPAVAAFALLSAANDLDDSVWWASWNDARWQDMQFVLPLEENPAISITQAALDSAIESGLSELAAATGENELASFYQGIIDRAAPSILFGVGAPLTGRGLAALLLPLSPGEAAQISLAGGLASTQFRPERLSHWSGIVSALPHRGNSLVSRRAALMARAVLERRPDILEAPIPKTPLTPAGRHLRAFLESDRRSIYGRRLPHSVAFSPIRASTDISPLIEAVSSFEGDIREGSLNEADEATRAARNEHLQAKADEAKAWLYVFAPGKETLLRLPPNQTGRVPALWFLRMLKPQDSFSLLEEYNAEEISCLFQHSLDPKRRHDSVVDSLVQFSAQVEDPSQRKSLLSLISRSEVEQIQ